MEVEIFNLKEVFSKNKRDKPLIISMLTSVAIVIIVINF